MSDQLRSSRARVLWHSLVSSRASNKDAAVMQHRILAFFGQKEVEALRKTNRRLHRRVQEAESVAASTNGQRIVALELELAEAKVERHKLRNENAFMKSERRRLQRRISALTQDAATAATPKKVHPRTVPE